MKGITKSPFMCIEQKWRPKTRKTKRKNYTSFKKLSRHRCLTKSFKSNINISFDQSHNGLHKTSDNSKNNFLPAISDGPSEECYPLHFDLPTIVRFQKGIAYSNDS